MDNYDAIVAYMVQHKIATADQLREARSSAQKKRANFLQQLLSDGLLSPSRLSTINREVFNLPQVALREMDVRRELTAQFKESVVRKHLALPMYAAGGRLFLATFDPSNRNMLDEFKYQGNYTSVEPIIANVDAIEALIEDHFAGMGGMDNLFEDESAEENLDAIGEALGSIACAEEEAPVVRCLVRFVPVLPTCILGLMKPVIACVFAVTAFCKKWRRRHRILPTVLLHV